VTARLLESSDVVQTSASMKRFGFQNLALGGLILVAGALSAVLLVLQGQGQSLPPLAAGATLGAFAMARFGHSE
jgi:hypothetical protein